jgi:lysophospholipase L1-like esterase
MKELKPGRNIAILKYSRGGTSIAIDAAANFGCWDPDYKKGNGVNQWDHFLAAVRGATAVGDIDGDGEPDRLIPKGIVWMQGESDAQHTEETAKKYQENLRRLMDLVRAALRADDVPVVIGRISSSADAPKKPAKPMSWKFNAIVREAQAAWVSADGFAKLVTSTDEYGYSDPWHYDSAGYVDLGKKFAEALGK